MRKSIRSILSCVCLLACCPCCFPCYICAIRSRKRRRQLEQDEALAENQRGPRSPCDVRPLRRGRRRKVSLPPGIRRRDRDEKGGSYDCGSVEVEEDGTGDIGAIDLKTKDKIRDEKVEVRYGEEEEQTTHTQNQSLLFQKLPPEIRRMVWKECVGGYDIYLGVVEAEKRIRHCKIFEGKGLMRASMDQEEQDRMQSETHLLPILLACRRIYTEAVPLLYTSNAFMLSSPSTLLSLSSTILLPRFNAITTLSIKWNPQCLHGLSFGLAPTDFKKWELTTRALASMKGLTDLRIVLWDRSIYGTPSDWENIGDLLKLLGTVGKMGRNAWKLRRFVVTLDQEDKVESLIKDCEGEPFELRFGIGDDGERLFWLI